MNEKLFLQGLVPRAKQLLALGLTFFLAFGPVILAISLLFSGIFWVSSHHLYADMGEEFTIQREPLIADVLQLYGENFIHGGKPGFTRYIDPVELLNEPTVDERIPFY